MTYLQSPTFFFSCLETLNRIGHGGLRGIFLVAPENNGGAQEKYYSKTKMVRGRLLSPLMFFNIEFMDFIKTL